MAFHLALVQTTGEEFITDVCANWDWVCALLPLPSNQVLYLVPSTRTEQAFSRILVARLAGSIVTNLHALVFPTVKSLATDFSADELSCTAFGFPVFLPTMASKHNVFLARKAIPWVAWVLALMLQAIQKFLASTFTAKFGLFGLLAGHPSLLFSTMAKNRDGDSARRALAWMAKHAALVVSAVLVLLFFAVLAT